MMRKWHRGNVDCLYKVDEEYPTQISVITWIGPFKHLFNSINHFLVLKTSVCYKTDRHILSKRLSSIN